MALIDSTYFVNEINLPSDNLANIDSYITLYQEEILRKLLGYELLEALENDLDVNGEPQSQRFIDLVNGAEFSFDFCGDTINEKWEGLRGINFKSLIAYYTYYRYRENTDTFFDGAGQIEPNHENSVNGDAIPKLVSVWNKMIDLYGDFHWCECYLPNYSPSLILLRDSQTYIHLNDYPSAYNFLLANRTNYPEWVFKPIRKLNQYGI